MADERKPGRVDFTAAHILSFPHLIKPQPFKNKAGKETGEPKFSGNIEIPADHVDLTTAKQTAAQIAKTMWPGRDLKELHFPFTNGDALAAQAEAKGKKREWSKGKVVLTARSKYRPRLAYIANGKIIDIDPDNEDAIKANQGKFFNGTLAFVQVTFSPYENPQQDGVNAFLDMVLTLNKGERIGGGASAADVFKGYVGIETGEDPTEGLDDEIPF